VAALARASGASHVEAARLATYAASVTVMKSGAAGLAPEELKEAVGRG
jgi:bifunctional ADP-heptose synthase (sugar kinase/adenylyltransferase)